MLVNHNTRPREVSHFIDFSATNIFVLILLVNGGSIWYFLTRLSDAQNFIAWLPLLLAGGLVLLPISYAEKVFKINEVRKSDEDTYESTIMKHHFNYQSSNPIGKDGKISFKRLSSYAVQDKFKQKDIIWGNLEKDIMNYPGLKKLISTDANPLGMQDFSPLPPRPLMERKSMRSKMSI